MVTSKPARWPRGFRVAPAPITPRAPQALAPPREAVPARSPAHTRACACSVGLLGLSGHTLRPIPGKLEFGPCRGEGSEGRVRAELELSDPGRGCRVSWTTSDQTLGGEPVRASSFGPRGPCTVIGSYARAGAQLCVAPVWTEEAVLAWHRRTPQDCTRPRHARPPRRSAL